jgi:SAM-dependent methyltransferase
VTETGGTVSEGGAKATEIDRFEFGRNWTRFLEGLDSSRIAAAERSLTEVFAESDLDGKTFLDVGSGSGIFSLAARRLGAHVHSFDYDPMSVACTAELKRRYYPDDPRWTVEPGDVLDEKYVSSLGQFDVVYAYGVLHHTGDMWRALDNVTTRVRAGGKLFLALYNDQGSASRRWRVVKETYNRSHGELARRGLVLAVWIYFVGMAALRRLVRLRNPIPSNYFSQRERGMSFWHDLVDWVGGYPFEVSKPEDVFDFCRSRGFCLLKLHTAGGGLANNIYVFQKQLAN